MAWFKKQRRQENNRKASRNTRICRFEQMESRLMLSADPIHIGAVFSETSSTNASDNQGDRFEITWTGGAAGTQLTELRISGDINQNGILDNGDVFFDIDGSGQGVGPYFPFTISPDSDIQADQITWSLSDDKTTLILHIQGWDAGEKLIFVIDVDELDSAPNSLVEGAEFQGSILTATWVDTNGHHDPLTASGTFFDNYDQLIPAGVDVPLDSQLPPGEGTDERTAGTGFSVQQQVTPFTISGTVYHDVNLDGDHDAGEQGIAGVQLSLYRFNEDTGQWEDTGLRSTTNANGHFSFTSNVPGKYRVVETQPDGYFSTGSTAGTGGSVESVDVITDITLLGGENSTGHKFGEALPGTLSGHVYHDADNDGVRDAGETGIGGVTIRIEAVGGGPAIFATTNADGSWSVSGLDPTKTYTVTEVQPGSWLDGKDAVGSLGGSLGNDVVSNVSFTTSGQHGENYNFGELLPATLNGRVFADYNNNGVFDGSDHGIAGVVVELLDANGNVITTTTTDANGYYKFTGLTPGESYGVREVQPVNYYDGIDKVGSSGGTITANDTIRYITLDSNENATGYDFAELPPASLSGYVYGDVNNNGALDGGDTRLAGVKMELLDANGNGLGIYAYTDANGYYKFDNLAPGTYGVRQVDQPDGWFDGLDSAGSAGGSAQNPGDKITGVTLNPGVHAVNYNFGELPPASLSGYVYVDVNDNGVRDGNEQGLAGIVMELLDANGNPTGITTVTDQYGRYTFTGLQAGTYGVRQVEQPDGYFDGRESVGSSGGIAHNPGDKITNVSLDPGEDATEYNFGELLPASISGYVYGDVNNNGTLDGSDTRLAGVKMELLDANGNGLGIYAYTDANGYYKFENLAPGVYGVRQVDQPDGWFDGLDSAGSAGGTAHNPGDMITGVSLAAGQNATNYNFGEVAPASLSGYVYGDLNNNGKLDSGEPRLAGVTLELLDANGNGTGIYATTDSNGFYRFENLPPGVYGVRQVSQPDGWYDGLESVGNAGGTAHNPGDKITGATLVGGQHATNYNFGELPPSSLSGYVYGDLNNNGVKNAGEQGIAGVRIELRDANGNVVATTETDANGYYKFENLAPGTYSVHQVDQPAGWYDGKDTAGSHGGTAHNPGDKITNVNLPHGVHATNYNFGELPPGSIAGSVFRDDDGDGVQDPGEQSIANVKIELLNQNGDVVATTYTDANGRFKFENVPPGVYSLRETQPTGYYDSKDYAGSAGGTAHNPGDLITNINLAAGQHAVNYRFTEVGPGSISGYVFQDGPPVVIGQGQSPDLIYLQSQRNGLFTPDDTPLAGVQLFLADAQGNLLRDANGNLITTFTDANGFYRFTGLAPGTYTIIQVQPKGFYDGIDTPGTTGGVAANFGNEWHPALAGLNHNYDVIAVVTVVGSRESQFNNFSEIAVTQAPILPPPPADPIPPTQWPGPRDLPFFGQVPVVPGAQVVSAPFYNVDLFFGTGATARSSAYSWHLSVIDAGNPRGGSLDGESLVSVAEARLDVFTSAHKQELRNGHFILPKEGVAEDEVLNFGREGAIPIAGDFNGDGMAEVGVFVAGNWYIDLNGNGVWDDGDLWAKLGDAGDLPVVGDWDGDGKDDIGIFGPEWAGDPKAVMSEPGLPDRQNETQGARKNMPPRPHDTALGHRTLKRTANGEVRTDVIDHVFYFGGSGDIPVAGDWNGDGVDTIGVFMNGTWILDDNGDGRWLPGETMVELGQAGDLPVVGDFNGDGVADLGVFRDGKWMIDINGNRTFDPEDLYIEFGQAGDLPVVADWNGDGIDEVGVYRQGVIQRPDL